MIMTKPTPFLKTMIAMAVTLLQVAAAEKVLIYTRNHVTNGKGYVHDNIAASVAAVKELCAEKGVGCDVSEDPAVFTAANLANYKAVIFSNSNNEAFSTPEQSNALTAYVEGGGGFVGIHSACGSERKNPDFHRVIGGTFVWHTPNKPFKVVVADKHHPATSHLPAVWAWKDEGYQTPARPASAVGNGCHQHH
jgi:uncharacterized protein